MNLIELRYSSTALKTKTAANILVPEPSGQTSFNVMFLLHGLYGDYTDWLRRSSIERYVEGLNLMIVMPDGGRGFYLDAEEGFQYGTSIGKELPSLIRSYFPVANQWCITGLSMGGYGAVRLALENPERFRSAASHSGAFQMGREVFDPASEIGPEFIRLAGPHPVRGRHDIHHLASSIPEVQRPSLWIDCGADDHLIEHNRGFHRHLTTIGYRHEYHEFPGAHEWAYWDLHVQDAIAFHREHLGF